MGAPHRNVLLLIADDLGKYLGCYGCSSIRTPRLDALAADGIRFTNAFASTASCSGSRSTIYTGLHTHENGQYGLNMHRTHFQTFGHIESAPRLFNDAGYQTGIIGKVHVGPPEVYPWEVWEESDSRDVAWVADRGEAFFEKAKQEGRPFFLTVGYIDPHRDITTRGGFGNERSYDSRIAIPEVKEDEVEVPTWLTDLPETRQEFVEYYQAIHRLDAGVGLILDALERQGLVESTLVIFTSDNGPPFINSKTTLYEAGTSLPLIVRCPGLGTAGGVSNPNMVSFIDILPTLLDWAGLDLAARSSHPNQSAGSPSRLGRSFLPVLTSTSVLPADEWQDHVFGSHTFHELQNYYPSRTLRTRRYKYHRNIAWRLDFPFASDLYASLTFKAIRDNTDAAAKDGPVMIGQRTLADYIFRPPEALYDLDEDPEEVRNLADRPEHQELLREMRRKLEDWQLRTGDLWLLRDGCSVKMLSRYGNDGLEVPDRFDFDAARPATEGIKMMKIPLDFGPS